MELWPESTSSRFSVPSEQKKTSSPQTLNRIRKVLCADFGDLDAAPAVNIPLVGFANKSPWVIPLLIKCSLQIGSQTDFLFWKLCPTAQSHPQTLLRLVPSQLGGEVFIGFNLQVLSVPANLLRERAKS